MCVTRSQWLVRVPAGIPISSPSHSTYFNIIGLYYYFGFSDPYLSDGLTLLTEGQRSKFRAGRSGLTVLDLWSLGVSPDAVRWHPVGTLVWLPHWTITYGDIKDLVASGKALVPRIAANLHLIYDILKWTSWSIQVNESHMTESCCRTQVQGTILRVAGHQVALHVESHIRQWFQWSRHQFDADEAFGERKGAYWSNW